ncbi:MAG: histidinol dehydrogenase, partial [Acetatifactor sp.]|nr:histidinol dehydrogenase [Acetatifactor sp.]
MRIVELTEGTRKNVLNDLLKRSPNNYSEYEGTVNEILAAVKTGGDKALFEYTLKFDKYRLTPENIRVTPEEIREAYDQMDPALVEVIRKSAANIRAFHEKQLRNSWFDSKEDGTILGIRFTPIGRVGVYVPGGKAAYPSSVLMNVVPVLSSVIELLGKIIFTQWIVPTTGYLGICFTEPIVWLAMALFMRYFYLKKSPLIQVGLSVHL